MDTTTTAVKGTPGESSQKAKSPKKEDTSATPTQEASNRTSFMVRVTDEEGQKIRKAALSWAMDLSDIPANVVAEFIKHRLLSNLK